MALFAKRLVVLQFKRIAAQERLEPDLERMTEQIEHRIRNGVDRDTVCIHVLCKVHRRCEVAVNVTRGIAAIGEQFCCARAGRPELVR